MLQDISQISFAKSILQNIILCSRSLGKFIMYGHVYCMIFLFLKKKKIVTTYTINKLVETLTELSTSRLSPIDMSNLFREDSTDSSSIFNKFFYALIVKKFYPIFSLNLCLKLSWFLSFNGQEQQFITIFFIIMFCILTGYCFPLSLYYQKASVALLSPLGFAFYTSWFSLLCYLI